MNNLIVHRKCQDLFSLRNKKKKKMRMSSAAVVTGTLGVNMQFDLYLMCVHPDLGL